MDTALPTLAERLTHADAAVRRLAVIDLPYSDEDDIVPIADRDQDAYRRLRIAVPADPVAA